jgi:hypothetical protein
VPKLGRNDSSVADRLFCGRNCKPARAIHTPPGNLLGQLKRSLVEPLNFSADGRRESGRIDSLQPTDTGSPFRKS